MRLRITAEIIGDIVLQNNLSAKFYIYTFEVYKKDDSCFLSIDKNVPDYSKYLPQINKDKSNHIHISFTDGAIYKDMIDWLKRVEAFGSFNLGITNILYDEAEITWIPESKDEENMLSITAHKTTRTKSYNHHISKSNLQDTLYYGKVLSDNYIPFTYFRLGKTFFDKGEYYLSYINYFLMIEFLYANGKTKQDNMKMEFEKSDVLVLSILMTIKTLPKKDSNIKWLKEECKNKDQEYNVDGIIHVLIKYRGAIAHGNKNRSGKYLDNQELLRPITFILGMICHNICGYLQIFSNIHDEQKDRFIKDKIVELGCVL